MLCLSNSGAPIRGRRGKFDTFELQNGNHLVVYNASAVDTISSLSEKFCIPKEHLHAVNSSNAAYQSLFDPEDISQTQLYDVPLSSSSRRVNSIYCWTRPAQNFIDFDHIPIGFTVRKEFVGSGFYDGSVNRKLSDKTLKVRQ